MKHIVGILALQGGFASHAAAFASLGVGVREVRTVEDLSDCSRLVIPGGESTVMTKLLMKAGTGPAEGRPWEPGPLFEALQGFASSRPVMGTCAGLIMLATASDDPRVVPLGVLPVALRRNGYGRQTESFIERIALDLPGAQDTPFTATFIRAPRITGLGEGVSVLARSRKDGGEGEPVMVRKGKILGLTFHPELTPGDARIHEYFLGL